MHILYFGCLATDLLDFFINTLLCVVMVTMLVNDIPQNVSLPAAYCDNQNYVHLNCLRLFDINFQSQEVREKYQNIS